MKDVSPNLLQQITINPIHWNTPLRVALLPYLQFTRSINRQLRELEARYCPASPIVQPNSRRFRSLL
ncbi:MAG: hypothetical protein JXB10_12970 [Pirellulales bacterium]|nr:hypothetical protein [Pirellulales bacterium]